MFIVRMCAPYPRLAAMQVAPPLKGWPSLAWGPSPGFSSADFVVHRTNYFLSWGIQVFMGYPSIVNYQSLSCITQPLASWQYLRYMMMFQARQNPPAHALIAMLLP